MMTREEAQAWAIKTLAELSEHFGVKAPSFRFNRTGSHGFYYSLRREVTTAVPEAYRYRRTITDSLLHEFAHHLADERNRAAREEARGRGVQWFNLPVEFAHHGANFKKALLEVATKFHGDPKKYAWGTEYKSIQSWARKCGLLAPRPTGFIGGLFSAARRIPVPMKTTAAFAISEALPTKTRLIRYPDFRSDLAAQYYKSGMRIGQIAKKLNGGRALGHTGNLVRAALRAAGIYKETHEKPHATTSNDSCTTPSSHRSYTRGRRGRQRRDSR